MKIIIDTCIWSIALRHNKIKATDVIFVSQLQNIISENRAQLLGAIRQEVLSGIRDKNQFEKLKEILTAFPDLVITSDIYCHAAAMYNEIRSKGIQGSPIDLLICAAAYIFDMPIFTIDKDFDLYSKHLPIKFFNFIH